MTGRLGAPTRLQRWGLLGAWILTGFLLVRAHGAGAAEVLSCGPEVICLEASRVRWDRSRRTGVAQGEVRLRAKGLLLKTPRLRIDLAAGAELMASLGAHLEAPWGELQAETLKLSLLGDTFEATEAHLSHRLESGRKLQLDAAFLQRLGGGKVVARKLRVTACGCGLGVPAWSVRAKKAWIDLERGAWLLSPLLEVGGIPLIWLPAFYLPLGSRRSGLLVPRLGYSGRGGIRITQPIYLVLGRSFDLTVEAGYWFGRDPDAVLDRRGRRVRPGPRGPATSLEFRYAPLRGTSGTLRIDHLFDLQRTGRVGEGSARRGQRYRIGWQHRTRFGPETTGRSAPSFRAGFSANVQLISDAALISDLGLRIEERQVGYLRSSVRGYANPEPATALEIGARYLQDLSSTLYADSGGNVVARPLFGAAEEGVPGTLQALPELHLARLERPIGLGVLASGELHGYAWLRPTGVVAIEDDATLPSLRFHGESAAARPFHLGSLATGVGAVEVHGDFSLPWTGGAPALRAWPRLRASLASAIEARQPGLLHRIIPSLEAIWAPPPLYSGILPGLDAFASEVSDAGVAQAVASLSSLFTTRGTRIEVLARQGWDALAAAPSDLDGRLRFERGPLRLRARMAYDWGASKLSLARASLSAFGPRQSRVGISYVRLEPWASAWLRVGLGERFDGGAVPSGILPQRIDEVSLSLRTSPLDGLQTSYALRIDLRGPGLTRPPQHVVGLVYEAPCKCLSVSLLSVWLPGQAAPELRFALDLAGLGG